MDRASLTELVICLNPALVLQITTKKQRVNVTIMKNRSKTQYFSSDRLEYLFGAALLKKVNSNPLTVTRFIQNPLKSAETNILTRPWG